MGSERGDEPFPPAPAPDPSSATSPSDERGLTDSLVEPSVTEVPRAEPADEIGFETVLPPDRSAPATGESTISWSRPRPLDRALPAPLRAESDEKPSRDEPSRIEEDASTEMRRERGSTSEPTSESSSRSSLRSDGSRDAVEEGPTVISRSVEPPPSSIAPLPDDQSSAEHFAKRLVGTSLDHYRLDEYIGGGGMGAVFRAHDSLLGRTVAVKILSKGSRDQELLRRFVNEAQSAAKLDHENIARVFFVGQDQGLNYIVFEYIEGRNVRQLIADEGVLSLSLAIRYMCQLARALEHAAARQVIHRDIKPSNVVITPDHRSKLVDMGLARMHRLDRNQAELTASDMTLGTFDYISPEQAHDPRAADTRSDLYSLGCTFYFMLTGEPPYPDGTMLQKVLAHREAPRPDPRDIRPDVPVSIVRIIQKLTAADVQRRYQTPNELLAELLLAAAELKIDVGLNESYIIEASVDRRDWFDRLVPWAAVAVLLVGTLLAIEWALPESTDYAEPDPSYRQVETSTARPIVPGESGSAGAASGVEGGSIAGTGTASSGAAGSAPTGGTLPMPIPSADRTKGADSPMVLPITTLVVGETTMPATPGLSPIATLEVAVERARRETSIREIQLAFDGTRDVRPLVLPPRGLRIIAASGRRPALRFRASQVEPGGCAVVIAGDEFAIRGVDLELQLDGPANREPPSLFRIEQTYTGRTWTEIPIQEFEFAEGKFTVLATGATSPTTNGSAVGAAPSSAAAATGRTNATETGTTMPNGSGSLAPIVASLPSGPAASLIEIRRPETFFLKLDNVDVVQYPRITVSRSLIRGRLHLLRALPGTPFGLQCQQSAFASSETALLLGGIRGDALLPDELLRTDVELRQVTLLGGGLIDLRADESTPAPLLLHLATDRCWFVPTTGTVLVRHRLLTTVDDDHLAWDGAGNLVTGRSLLWQREIGMQPDRMVEPGASLFATSLASLERPQLLDEPPAALRPFLSGSTGWERFEGSDLATAAGQLPTGVPRRAGVLADDLPRPAAMR